MISTQINQRNYTAYQPYIFDYSSRRGESGVLVEVYCAAIGFNIRKYHKAKIKKEMETRERLKQEKAVEKPETIVNH